MYCMYCGVDSFDIGWLKDGSILLDEMPTIKTQGILPLLASKRTDAHGSEESLAKHSKEAGDEFTPSSQCTRWNRRNSTM
jgi:hypothetical protein